jgi:hypothetical protein
MRSREGRSAKWKPVGKEVVTSVESYTFSYFYHNQGSFFRIMYINVKMSESEELETKEIR